MWHSIQQHLQKINSHLSWTDCVSLLITTILLICFTTYLYLEKSTASSPVRYISDNSPNMTKSNNSLPFASASGKTYTFSWCHGATTISEKNKIYFKSEEEAIKSGRVLSKLCQK